MNDYPDVTLWVINIAIAIGTTFAVVASCIVIGVLM